VAQSLGTTQQAPALGQALDLGLHLPLVQESAGVPAMVPHQDCQRALTADVAAFVRIEMTGRHGDARRGWEEFEPWRSSLALGEGLRGAKEGTARDRVVWA